MSMGTGATENAKNVRPLSAQVAAGCREGLDGATSDKVDDLLRSGVIIYLNDTRWATLGLHT